MFIDFLEKHKLDIFSPQLNLEKWRLWELEPVRVKPIAIGSSLRESIDLARKQLE